MQRKQVGRAAAADRRQMIVACDQDWRREVREREGWFYGVGQAGQSCRDVVQRVSLQALDGRRKGTHR